MNFGRLLVIFVDRRVIQQPSSLDFGGLHHRLSSGWSWSTSLASSHFSTCFGLIFTLAFISFFHLLWSFLLTCFVFRLASCFDLLRVSTCFVFRLASCFDLLRVSTCFVFRLASCCYLLRLDLSTSLRALAVNSLGGLIIFRMLGAYGDSSGTLIPALWVHLSPLSDRRWTSLSVSALWSFIPGSQVGSSLSLNIVALPTTYLL